MYFEVSASSVAFLSSARRACSISSFLRSTSAFCFGELLRLLLELLIRQLQLFLLGLQLGRQLLRLLQALGFHGYFNAV